MEKKKDLDLAYVNNRLEKYNDLVQSYSILRTTQQINDANGKFNEWWELAKVQFQEKMQKNLDAHKKNETA